MLVRSERLRKLRWSWYLSVNGYIWKHSIITVFENLLSSSFLRPVSYCWDKECWLLGFDLQKNIFIMLWGSRFELKPYAVLWHLQGRRFFTSCSYCYLMTILTVPWLIDALLQSDFISVLAVLCLYVVSASSSLYNNASQIGWRPLSKILT